MLCSSSLFHLPDHAHYVCQTTLCVAPDVSYRALVRPFVCFVNEVRVSIVSVQMRCVLFILVIALTCLDFVYLNNTKYMQNKFALYTINLRIKIICR